MDNDNTNSIPYVMYYYKGIFSIIKMYTILYESVQSVKNKYIHIHSKKTTKLYFKDRHEFNFYGSATDCISNYIMFVGFKLF